MERYLEADLLLFVFTKVILHNSVVYARALHAHVLASFEVQLLLKCNPSTSESKN